MGAQELQFPALLPREPYEATGRWTEYGDGIFRLKDRKGADYLLGPTHEELFTLVVKDLYSSYKDLPGLALPDPDEVPRRGAPPRRRAARPRVRDEGLLLLRRLRRGPRAVVRRPPGGLREDLRPARLRLRHRQGHLRRDGRLDVRGVPGHRRERRGHLRPLHVLRLRRQRRGRAGPGPPSPSPYDDAPAAHAEQTPDTPTIETLVDHLNDEVPARRPALERRRHPQERHRRAQAPRRHPRAGRDRPARRPRGRREAARAASSSPSRSRRSTRRTSRSTPSLAKGYIGPGVLGEKNESGIRYLVDPRIVEGTRWVTGADVTGSHVIDLVAGRDFTPDGTIEAAEVRDGDPCPQCALNGGDGTLHTARGIEMGHIFALGRKYADALGLQVLDENGKLVTVTMGSYGIGVSRAVAAIAENTHDELGLVWPREVAPADVHLVATGKDQAVYDAAAKLAVDLTAQGPDRAVRRPGRRSRRA